MALEDFVVCACPSCGEPMEIAIDPDAGDDLELYEDCAVCCRPARVRLWREGERWRVDVTRGHA